jgi:hypothetical protein
MEKLSFAYMLAPYALWSSLFVFIVSLHVSQHGVAFAYTLGLKIDLHTCSCCVWVWQVEIRACKGSADDPIIVDTNRLGQFICVYGYMLWQGNIKFTNIEPPPRRAFLYPLVSSLSVEQDGIVAFEV